MIVHAFSPRTPDHLKPMFRARTSFFEAPARSNREEWGSPGPFGRGLTGGSLLPQMGLPKVGSNGFSVENQLIRGDAKLE